MIRYLIDTDCAVYAMTAQYPALGLRLSNCAPGEAAISAVSFAEVVLGSEMGKPPPMEILDAFIRAVPIVPFDEGAAREYAKLPFKRARFDRLLAAHALSFGATIVTTNEADFAEVPGLVVENWTLP
ncbi:MAG: type II toxin-antitoxin system VapC family toxin [Sphingopyxis sp.]